MRPTASVSNSDSLGDQIQRAYPQVTFVKTLNIATADLMVHPRQFADGDHQGSVSGNDAEAQAQAVDELTTWFGRKQIIDLGDISTARGSDMYRPLRPRPGAR